MSDSAKTMKRAFIWNIIGSGLNAAATMILTIAATRMAGVEAGGVLGLAFGLCQVFAEIASYEVRPFQSTDLEERFRFQEYYGLRLITCLVMTVICAGYVFGFQYTGEKASVVFAVCMFKMLDSFSDLFQGLFQQKNHLEYAGQALSLRIAVAGGAYILVLGLTKSPLLAAWAMPLSSIPCIALFDMRLAKRFADRVAPVFHWDACKKILVECFPLFASAFMNMYILNASKIQVDRVAPHLQGYWTPIYMPAAVINLFSIFAFRPMLTMLRAQWSDGENRAFLKSVGILVGWVVLVTLLALGGGYLLGIPVLQLLYGLDLGAYRGVLMLVLVGGGFNAMATVLYYVITVMRRQYFLILGEGITFLSTLLLTPILVEHRGLQGAALAYLACMVIRTLCFALISGYGYRSRDKV